MRARLLLTAAVLVAFGASLGSGFHFDDYAIFADRALTSISGWREVWAVAQTRPLTYLTFWLNFQMGGNSPAGYHAVNLLLHIAAVLLLYGCLERLLPERLALTAAAVFAVHPAVSEAVLYVWGRSILLATVFCLLALRDWQRQRHWRAAAWFAAALLSKEEAAAFPLVLLLLDRKAWKPAAAMLLLDAAAGARVIYAAAVTPGALIAQTAGIGPAGYLFAQGSVVLRYLLLVVWPWGFTVDPDGTVYSRTAAALAWAALIVLVALAWRRRDREGGWLLAGLILLLPSSSFFPVADVAADRRLYLPMTAFAVVIAHFLSRRRWEVSVALCAVLAALSLHRTHIWDTEEALWREAVERSPRKLRPKLQLARVVPLPEALTLLAQAERLAPGDPAVPAETGAVLLAAGRPAEALPAFGRALAMDPRDARNYNNRGTALAALGQDDAAGNDFHRALEIDPGLESARDNLRRLGQK